MQRLRDERGAVAVFVALIMVVLIGFAAIAIDVSAMWAKRQQLQTGADAGALAIAQDCARSACGNPVLTAQTLAGSNVNDGQANATVIWPAGGQVTVKTSDVQVHWFARVLGSDQSTIGAQATAKWGWPSGGTTLPLTFSWCEWNAQTGGLASTTEHVIDFSNKSHTGCTGPSGLAVPGGFGWVNPDSGSCTKASILTQTLSSDTGNTPPGNCSPADFEALLNTVVLIPIFDSAADSGGNATYHVFGYAAFKITGYFFGGQYSTNPKPCNGSNRCVKGYFTRYVDLDEAFDTGTGAPQLGAAVVSLVN